jgi:hypothetical protein
MSDSNRSLPELFGNLVSQLSTLFRKEVQLARAEMGEKVGQATGSVALLAAGGVLLLAALIILLEAVVAFVASFGVPVPWARLIVAVVVALVGYALVRSGMSGLKASNLVPNRTVEQLSRDAAVAKEQVQ